MPKTQETQVVTKLNKNGTITVTLHEQHKSVPNGVGLDDHVDDHVDDQRRLSCGTTPTWEMHWPISEIQLKVMLIVHF